MSYAFSIKLGKTIPLIMKKTHVLFSLLLGGIFLLSGCAPKAPDSLLEKVKQEQQLTVGYISYFDLTFKDLKTGEYNGFLVELLYEVVKDLDIPKDQIRFVETDWQNFGRGLEIGKYDFSIAGTFQTPPREKVVNFTQPIFYLGNGAIVGKDDDRFQTIEDFNRDSIVIAVVQGEQGYEYAQENLPNAELKVLSGSDLTLAPLQVKNGAADAALSDQYILKRYADQNPEVKDALSDRPYGVLPICWAVNKKETSQSLLLYLNSRLQTLEENGFLAELQAKYADKVPFAPVPAH